MLDSSICLAVAPVVQSLGGDTIGSVCSSDPLVGPKRAAKNYWSLAITNTVSCNALAKVIATRNTRTSRRSTCSATTTSPVMRSPPSASTT